MLKDMYFRTGTQTFQKYFLLRQTKVKPYATITHVLIIQTVLNLDK